MIEALLIGAIVIGVLACPTMMWLGRRGIAPGCAMMGGCETRPGEHEESLESLRKRERELARRIAELEPGAGVSAAVDDEQLCASRSRQPGGASPGSSSLEARPSTDPLPCRPRTGLLSGHEIIRDARRSSGRSSARSIAAHTTVG